MRKFALVLSALAVALAPSACGGRERLGPQAVVERTSPAVVSITGKFGETDVGGSGVVFDAERGFVLTNAHVVSATTALKGKVGDEAPVPLRVLGRSPCDDLAVLEMVRKPDGLKELPFAKSGALKRAEHVTALGFPDAFNKPTEQTLSSTDGRVSNPAARSRTLDPTLPDFPVLIQHQAPLNLGNSGGALVNDYGELVGVNTQKVIDTPDAPAEGQGFAIPADEVKKVVGPLVRGDSIDFIGWNLVPTSTVDISDQFKLAKVLPSAVGQRAERTAKQRKLNKKGLYNVISDDPSPALTAEIVSGDVITAIDGTPVADFGDACSIAQAKSPGDKLSVSLTQFDSAQRERDVFRKGEIEVKLPKAG